MGSDDELARPSPVTYARSRRPEDEETVPDSEDSTSRAEPRLDDDLPKRPIKGHGDESEPPRPPRAVYRSHKRALSPPSLSYTSLASTEEVIPDSEENGRGVGSSDDEASDDIPTSNVPRTTSSGLSDWKQKLRDIDTEYDMDDSPSGPHPILSPASNSKETSSEDPFGSPLTTHASSQLASHRSPTDALPSSPPLNASSSTNTTPQFVFGTPQAPSPTPPTSDGKPSPIRKTKSKGKAKGKTRALSEVQEASVDDQLVPSSGGVRQTRRKEKQKKTKVRFSYVTRVLGMVNDGRTYQAPTKKELLETRRETARMKSDLRVSISTEATRPLGVEVLLERFRLAPLLYPLRCRVLALTWNPSNREPEARPLQPHSSISEIEAWSSSSPSSSASRHDHGRPEEAHQDRNAEPSHQQSKPSRRSVSPFHSNGLLAPASKYKTVTFAAIDDPFLATTPTTKPHASKETDRDANAGSGSDSDAEMPGIGAIFAQRQAREDQRTKQEQLQQFKLNALEKQKKTPGNAAAAADDTDDSDDGLDIVPDTMHSVAREEAAARAVAGKPSAGRNTQLRFARVGPSPQRPALLPTESPEKRMAVAARPAFLASFARGNGAAGTAAGRGKRGAGMTKAELDQMMLRSADAQNKQLRGSKEEEWVRRGGRVTGIMQDVGSENLQAVMEALERGGGTDVQDGGDDEDEDEDEEDGDYVPVERGSASPQPMKARGEGHDDQEAAADEDIMQEDEHRVADDRTTEAAVDTDSETESSAPDDVRLRRPRGARPRHAVIGSDDESGAENAAEEDVHPPPLSLPDLPSPAFASPWPSRHPAPDHGDEKENDPDVSGNDTDKENRAVVVCRMPPSSAPVQGARVLFDDLLGARAAAQPMSLLGEDDPFVFTPSPVKARDEALRRMESPTPVRVFGTSGKRGLSQMFEEEDGAPMPQGCNDNGAARDDADTGFVEFKSALGGLSQAFEQTQVRRPFRFMSLTTALNTHAGYTRFCSRDGRLRCSAARRRRRALTHFRCTGCGPAARAGGRRPSACAGSCDLREGARVRDPSRAARGVSSRTRVIHHRERVRVFSLRRLSVPPDRRADAADGTVVVAAHRFLTQTRPEGSSSPLVYRPSPSQQQRPYDALLRTQSEGVLGTAASSPLAARQPLSTLAETSPQSSVGREPLRRLRRAQTSPEAPVTGSGRRYAYPRGQSLSPSPSPSHAKTKGGAAPAAPAMMMQGRTAFSELMLGAKSAVHRDGERAKAKKRSEFVEDQAVESDEDDMLGFGGVRKKNGDEEEDENDEHDAEGVLKDLVDDAQMDESAIAKSKVLEKHLCVSSPCSLSFVAPSRMLTCRDAENNRTRTTNVSKRRCKTSLWANDAHAAAAVARGASWAQTRRTTNHQTTRHARCGGASRRSGASRGTRSTHSRTTRRRRHSTRRTNMGSSITRTSLRIWTGMRARTATVTVTAVAFRRTRTAVWERRRETARIGNVAEMRPRTRTKTWRWRRRPMLTMRSYPPRMCARRCKTLRAANGYVGRTPLLFLTLTPTRPSLRNIARTIRRTCPG